MRTMPPHPGTSYTEADRTAILDRVDELLDKLYEVPVLVNAEDPLDEVIFFSLSDQDLIGTEERGYAALRARWPTWQSAAEASARDLESVLKPWPQSTRRARTVWSVLKRVADDCANQGLPMVGLSWLRDLDDTTVRKYLRSLPGMTSANASYVMCSSLDRGHPAVDPHIRRILERLGVLSTSSNHETDGKLSDSAIPAKYRKRLYAYLIKHGRAYCKARAPICDKCPLISFCVSGRVVAARRYTELKPNKKGRAFPPIAVELFAGGGGLGEGFARSGFKIAAAVELDRSAAQTYRLNHPGTVVLEADAMKITADDLAAFAPIALDATAVIAGPPCQGYSVAGKRRAADDKNSLYLAVVNLAKSLRPRFVIIENVPGLRRIEGHSFVEKINGALRDIGYNSREYLLRACDFGVPQLRRRMLFLAQRADLGPAPMSPEPTHCAGNHCSQKCGSAPGSRCGREATPTVLDALKNLPALAPGHIAERIVLEDGFVLLNGSTMDHSEKVIKKISTITPGSGPISYRRLHPDIARTIVAGHRALPVHPYLDRTISVREAARIQGFDDDHMFCGPRSQQPLQVANAVPPPLAEAIARSLLSTTDRE